MTGSSGSRKALDSGDMKEARAITVGGGSGEEDWKMTLAFLEAADDGYGALAAAAAGSVSFAGRLEHDEVGELVPACDALVMPSTFPEAFGMVAAEAASAGVLPISAAHSGMLEVSRELAETLPDTTKDLVSFALGSDAVDGIARRLQAWFELQEADRTATREALSATAHRLWSWEGVARKVLAASAGDLADIPRVPDA